MRFVLPAIFLSAALALSGCTNTDPAVFVDATLTNATVTVQSSTLGAALSSSSFHIKLHLGARASGASTVSFQTFQLLAADTKATIVASLSVTPSVSFPVTVDPDTDLEADFTFDTPSDELLSSSVVDAICSPAGVVVAATLHDSLATSALVLYSPVFHPTGCN